MLRRICFEKSSSWITFQPFKDFKDKFNVFRAEVQTVFEYVRDAFRVNFRMIISQLKETQMNPETGMNRK